MERSPHITVPHQESDANNFEPVTKLPEHLQQYALKATDLREKVTPMLRRALELTDKTVLRSAALPQTD